MSIATNIMNIASTSMKGYRELRSITVQIGQLAGVEIESLQFCFNAIKRSSPFPEVELIIEEVPGKGVCASCGSELLVREPFAFCEQCGDYTIEITQGKELKITSLVVK